MDNESGTKSRINFKERVLQDSEGVLYTYDPEFKNWKTSNGKKVEHSVVRHWYENRFLTMAANLENMVSDENFLHFTNKLLIERNIYHTVGKDMIGNDLRLK